MSLSKKPICLLLLSLILIPQVNAIPSGNTTPPSGWKYNSGYWHDSWGITRNSAEGSDGSDGYLPKLASETLGINKELAYKIGERFLNTYSDSNSRADAILKYIQKWTEYGYDSDNVVIGGQAQDEWAWNADEMAHAFDENLGKVAIGDCEDMAFLGFTIYSGAGFDTAVIDAPEHCALLIWLPDYPNANQYWELSQDNRGAGWIWVEATGPTNPVGWTPSDFSNGDWTAYTLANGVYTQRQPVQTQSDGTGGTDGIDLQLIISIIFFIFFIISKILRR